MHASLAFLSYNRPGFLEEALDTALINPGFDVEVIVHDDGSDNQDEIRTIATSRNAALTLLARPGYNEGVGRAINRCFSVATGDYLVKLDQDLIFTDGWLKKAIGVIDVDPFVGMVGMFKYHHDPCKWWEMQRDVDTRSGTLCVEPYHYVEDFVSSAFVIPRSLYDAWGPLPEHSAAFAEDIEFKKRIQAGGYELALLDEDVITNRGFGIGPSTVVTRDGVQKIKEEPWVIRQQ